MASGNYVLDKGYNAGGAITKFRAVFLSAVQEVSQLATQGATILGVAQFGVTTAEILKGKGASVRLMGITEWEAGAAVGIGVEVMTDNVGRCIPATTGNRVVGKCVGDPAVNAGDRSTVLLYTGGFVHA